MTTPNVDAAQQQATQDMEQLAGTPIFEGSMIRQVGNDFYIGDTKVTQEGEKGAADYRDADGNIYDAWGRPMK